MPKCLICNFVLLMRYCGLLALFLLFAIKGWAQVKTVPGFVVDKDSKQRLAKVFLYNPASTDEGIFNNTKGEFYIKANVGDTIFAALGGYAPDTIIYRGQSALVLQLKSLGIMLKEVQITGKTPTPKEQYEKNLQTYKSTLAKGSSKDLLNAGMGTVGLGIDAIYNLLSKEGKAARRLQSILEKDYHEAIIDYRFRPEYVKNLLKINDAEAKDFMPQYRPTYSFVLTANEYEFVNFVKNSYASYKRNPNMFKLPKLPKAEFNPQNQ